MSIKAELGKKIRKLREERGLSRGELCEGEEELTVRQLARIEVGESLPTLPNVYRFLFRFWWIGNMWSYRRDINN